MGQALSRSKVFCYALAWVYSSNMSKVGREACKQPLRTPTDTPLHCIALTECGACRQGACHKLPATQWQRLPKQGWILRCPAPVGMDPSSETSSAPEYLLHIQANITEHACPGKCTASFHDVHGSMAAQAAQLLRNPFPDVCCHVAVHARSSARLACSLHQ